MPELPEVEFSRRRLRDWTLYRPIERVDVLDPRALNPMDHDLVGRSFQGWERRGKYLVGRLDDERVLVSHLGMTGKWVRDPQTDRPHQRIVLRFGDEQLPRSVGLVDPRRLGLTWLLTDAELVLHPRLTRLGPDAGGDAMDPAILAQRVGSDMRPLKRRLMDQAVVAGLGNIMVAEMCWRAGIHPHEPCARIDAAVWTRLYDAMSTHIEEVLENEQGDEILYLSTDGSGGGFLCYGRAGQPCGRCGTPLDAGKLDGRTSTWCPRCQPLEA